MAYQSEAASAVKRVWGDVPVIDSTADLRVMIQPSDIKAAIPKDPEFCVFARACKRAFKSKKVLFLRTVAYVELPDEKGNHRVERFIMNQAMRDLIADFDKGKGIPPRGGFVLQAPPVSQSLEGMRDQERREKKNKRAVMLAGGLVDTRKIPGRRGQDVTRQQPVLYESDVRNGTGSVHFTLKHPCRA